MDERSKEKREGERMKENSVRYASLEVSPVVVSSLRPFFAASVSTRRHG